MSTSVVLRLGPRASTRVQRRRLVAGLLLGVAAVVLFLVALATGDVPLPLGDVVAVLTGDGDPGTAFIVEELRLPRATLAVLVGAALGVSGAIFQSLTRNPLGSPDVVGFQAGSVTGALVVVTILGGGGSTASLGAMVSGTLTAMVVYGLARKDGSLAAFRLVLIGVGVSALLYAVNELLLSRARIEEAQEATRWLLGSLSGRGWGDVQPLAVGLVVLAPMLAFAARALRVLELGDDLAHGLGLGVEKARIALILVAIALVALATSAAGPLTFVALTAPQIARRLARTAEPNLLGAALTGVVITLGADVLAQQLVPSTPLPAGIITGAAGGLYLAWLLALGRRSWRTTA